MDAFYLALDKTSAEMLLVAVGTRLRIVDRYDREKRVEYHHLLRMKGDIEVGMLSVPIPGKLAGHISTSSGV